MPDTQDFRRLVALAALVLVAAPGAAPARTWRVPADAPTLQAGVDSAAAGDTVGAAPGTYRGIGNRDVSFLGKRLVVRSDAGPAATLVDCEGNDRDPHRGFFLGHQEPPGTVLEGFTIVNGYMSMLPSKERRTAHDLSAGGIKIQDLSTATVRDCVVRGCASEFTGGGISVEIGSDAVLENVVVMDCHAGIFGGGISVETTSNAVLRGCVVTGNVAPTSGGIECSAQVTIEDCVVAGNAATIRGGGLYVGPFGRAHVERSIVWGNCQQPSGEIYVDNGGRIDFACSVLDPAQVVLDPGGTLDTANGNVFAAPRFCFPLQCTAAPTVGGDYRVQDGSPCLAAASPCSQPIGPLGRGCISQTAATPFPWAGVKRIYR